METELERLIIRLVGDGSEYQKMLEQAAASSQEAARQVEQATGRMEQMTNQLNAAGTAMVAVGAAMTAAFGMVSREALGNFQEAEAIGLKLNAVLESNGRSVETLTKNYQEWAVALEKTTTMEDDATLALLGQAEAFDLTGESAKKAVKDAIALAAVVGGQADSYLRLTAQIAKGDIETAMSMARMVPQLRGIKNETEFLTKANKLFETGMKAAEAEMKSSAGSMKALKRDYGNMLEDIGAVIAQGLQPIVSWLSETVKWFRGLDDSVKAGAAVLLGFGTGVGILLTAVGGSILVYNNLIVTLTRYITTAQLATTWSIAMQAAFVGLAGYIVFKVITSLYGLNQKLDEYNATVQRSRDMSDSLTSSFKTQTAAIIANARAAPAADRSAQLEKDLKQAEAALENYKDVLKQTEADVTGAQDGLVKSFAHAATFGVFQDPFGKLKEVDAAAIAAAGSAVEAAKNRVKELTAEMDRFKNPKLDPKLVRDVEELTKKLQEQVQTHGMATEAAEIHKLKLAGATDAMLANARGLQDMNAQLDSAKKAKEEAADAAKKLQDDIKGLTQSLESEIATWGMSTDAAKLHKLALEGASEAQLANARGLMDMKNQLAATKRIMEEGAQVTKEYLTPTEQFSARIAELQKMLDAGAVSEATFGRAMKDAQTKLDATTKETKKAHQEISKFDAALVGSAEAASRISAYQDLIANARTDGASAVKDAMSLSLEQSQRAAMGPHVAEHGMEGGMWVNPTAVETPKPTDAESPVQQRMEKLLEAAVEQLRKIADEPTIDLQGAGLG